MSRTVVAICGKGGVGKTTVSGLLARALDRTGRRALLVDADPAGGLTMTLGLSPPRSLDDLRRELIVELAGRGESAPAPGPDLARDVDYRLLELLEERGVLALLEVGRPEEAGCYCKLNGLLRQSIEALSAGFELTVVDAEAGVEQVNRRVLGTVTHLLVVSDLSRRGLRVARTVVEVARRSAPDLHAGLVLNRVGDDAGGEPGVLQRAAASADLPLVLTVPEDPRVAQLDREARPYFELEQSPGADALERWLATHPFLAPA